MRLAEETIIDRTKAPRLEALVNRHKSAAQNRAYMSARWEIAHQAIVYDDENKLPTVNVVIKADGVGTVEALSQIVKSLASRTTDVTLNIVHSAVGAINSSDVERAHAVGNCMVLGFNVDLVDSATRSASKELDVEVHNNDVIYRLEDALLEAMQKVMPKERLLHLEVRSCAKLFS
jgi:translation initiation factor IF-2